MMLHTVPSGFASGVLKITDLYRRYYLHVMSTKKDGKDFSVPYDAHTIVRALETFFYTDFECVFGSYISANKIAVVQKLSNADRHTFTLERHDHSWLVFKDDPTYMIDVLPVYTVPGFYQVAVLCTKENTYGYISSGYLEPCHWSPEQIQKLRSDADELSDILQSLV